VGRQPGSKDLAIPRSHHDAAAIAASLSARSWADRKQPTLTHLRPGALGSERPNVHGVFYRNSTALGQAISRHGRDIGYRGRGAR
jgi:hypothetical protein